MMSSITSSVIAQAAPAVDLHLFNPIIPSEAVVQAATPENVASKFSKSFFQRAPSVSMPSAAQSGVEGLTSMAGMASSTAMKMLRAGNTACMSIRQDTELPRYNDHLLQYISLLFLPFLLLMTM
jgi:hypothetical protein